MKRQMKFKNEKKRKEPKPKIKKEKKYKKRTKEIKKKRQKKQKQNTISLKNTLDIQRQANLHMYLFREVSNHNLYWIDQVIDGEVPHTAGHDVAVQRPTVLLFLKDTRENQ